MNLFEKEQHNHLDCEEEKKLTARIEYLGFEVSDASYFLFHNNKHCISN